jgi:hypothetical protein
MFTELRATPVFNFHDGRGVAGAYHFEANFKGMFYICPCGCGTEGFVGFRGRVDPPHPSWEWNGSRESPTLEPSILKTSGCRWHGYLTNGVWRTV